MSTVRFASAAVNSCLASFAVLRLEPMATMPSSAAATANAITDGSNWSAPRLQRLWRRRSNRMCRALKRKNAATCFVVKDNVEPMWSIK